MNSDLPSKLRMARKATGLSTREVVALLPSSFSVAHSTLSNYESGKTQPSIDVLTMLAGIYERPVEWFLGAGPSLTSIRYRNLKSRVRARDRAAYEASAYKWLVAYVRLEEALKRSLRRRADLISEAPRDFSPDDLALWVRTKHKLHSDQPIPSVMSLLEWFGIRVIEVPVDMAIDGFAARFGDEHVVVLNSEVSNDRARMNAAHELGHILYGDTDDRGDGVGDEQEDRAFAFASKLLLPDKMLRLALQTRSIVRLVSFKEKYGLSLAAMIYRGEEDGILKRKVAKSVWIEFTKRGWRRTEPGSVRPDRATRFEQILDSAILNDEISWREAEHICGISANELERRIRNAAGFFMENEEASGIDKNRSPQEGLRLVR